VANDKLTASARESHGRGSRDARHACMNNPCATATGLIDSHEHGERDSGARTGQDHPAPDERRPEAPDPPGTGRSGYVRLVLYRAENPSAQRVGNRLLGRGQRERVHDFLKRRELIAAYRAVLEVSLERLGFGGLERTEGVSRSVAAAIVRT
jgi:hypothetical protein